jgi:hypothetical protein
MKVNLDIHLVRTSCAPLKPLFQRIDLSSQCNEGGASFTCADATTACNRVHSYDYSFGSGQTAMQIATYGSVTVWLTRAKSSSLRGDMNALCHRIVSGCCSGEYMTKSQAPFQSGEQGSI